MSKISNLKARLFGGARLLYERRRSKASLSIVVLILFALHTFTNWKIDGIGLALIVLGCAPFIVPLIKSVKLPGGTEIELRDIQDAAKLVSGASTTPPRDHPDQQSISKSVHESSDASDQTRALSDSPSTQTSVRLLREIANQNAEVALTGFRIELERRLRMIADRHGDQHQFRSVAEIVRFLSRREVLTSEESEGLQRLIRIGNEAAHGTRVSQDAVNFMFEVAPRILAVLDRKVQEG